MSHTCYWPSCPKEVPPSMWGCRSHWFKLPKHLRDEIWATYRAGQEITKTPSDAYLDAARAVQEWIATVRRIAGLDSEGASSQESLFKSVELDDDDDLHNERGL